MTTRVRDSLIFVSAALGMGLLFFDVKLSLSGDNAEFVILGRALAAGKGLVYLNNPALPPGTKYPPGFPTILAAADLGFPGSIAAMKAFVVLAYAISIPFTYLLLIRHATRGIACSVTVLCLISPILLEYSHQLMSEVPFLLASLGAFVCFEYRKPGIVGMVPTLLAMMAAYYTRTAGVAVIVSILLLLALRKEHKLLVIVSVGAILLALPWSIHTHIHGGSQYLQKFTNVDPYRSDLGTLSILTLLERVGENLWSYFFRIIPSVVLPVPYLSYPTTSEFNLLLYLVAAIPSALVLYFLFAGLWLEGLTSSRVYLGVYFCVILLWPNIWSGYRFLIPIAPLLYFASIWSVQEIGDRLRARRKWRRWVSLLAAVMLFGSNAVASVDLYARRGTHPPNWDAYFKAGEWIRDHSSPDALVACRKAFLMHLVSGRYTTGYVWGEPDEVVAEMEKSGVNLVVLDELPYNSTPEHLVPALNTHRDRFRILHQIADHDTYVLELGRISTLPDSQDMEGLSRDAHQRLQDGDLDGASTLLSRALTRAPTQSELWIAYFNLGGAFQRNGEMEKALGIYNDVVAGIPEYPNVHLNLGILYYDLRKYDASISAFRKAISNGVDNARLRYSLAKAYERLGALEGAIDELLMSLKFNRDLPQTYLALAAIHEQMGNDVGAQAALEEGLARLPGNQAISSALNAFQSNRQHDTKD
ncbi:MAG TPA: hypothetical protein DIU35_08310 [Candidatus Latescibacteria bacterium]|nr:hypothetical protein [Candidatus Latescibacterota bacterium]|tara:strand:+ start:3332 stop:5434 length:2103 start_codon:yes stop_codon:yes gene_type:complete